MGIQNHLTLDFTVSFIIRYIGTKWNVMPYPWSLNNLYVLL